MKKYKFSTRIISLVLTFAMSLSMIAFGTASVSALDKNDINDDGMELGYSIINGYTKLALKDKQSTAKQKIAVYSGLNVNNPYLIMLLGLFYFNKSVELNRIPKDNAYAVETITSLNSFLNSMGIKNSKANDFKSETLSTTKTVYTALDTVGFYVIDSTKSSAFDLMDNANVDFVLAGGKVPSSLKDLNLDGRSDITDAGLIQQFLSKALLFMDKDEANYALYASDINEDKKINISDVTVLQRSSIF